MADDSRDISVPSVVAIVRSDNKRTALEEMLEAAHFFDTLEAVRAASGKAKEDFLVVMKPNFMMTIRIEDPPVV